ncbi:hypothetical protein [Scytonema sp. NUACC26]|uniref:hypothetical protein n=1 Tax=Scytonema sp. NUACC26 TaxID=3140176 RepID=UPI0034DBE712
MKSLGFYEKRLQDLEKNITEDQKLLKQYEDVLRYESDPRAIGRYKREIERQRESVSSYIDPEVDKDLKSLEVELQMLCYRNLKEFYGYEGSLEPAQYHAYKKLLFAVACRAKDS